MPSWYALHVKTGSEGEIASALKDAGLDVCSPTRKMIERKSGHWGSVERTMLQGYVLVKLEMSVKAYNQIRTTNGVIRFLGETMPESIPDDQMGHMLILANGGAPWEPSSGHMDGETLVIDSGPLAGREKWIVELDARRKRAKAEVKLLKDFVSIELAVEITGRQEEPEGDASPTEEASE